MTPTDPNGEIDFYRLWAQAQRRIYELERILRLKDEAIRKKELG